MKISLAILTGGVLAVIGAAYVVVKVTVDALGSHDRINAEGWSA